MVIFLHCLTISNSIPRILSQMYENAVTNKIRKTFTEKQTIRWLSRQIFQTSYVQPLFYQYFFASVKTRTCFNGSFNNSLAHLTLPIENDEARQNKYTQMFHFPLKKYHLSEDPIYTNYVRTSYRRKKKKHIIYLDPFTLFG